MLGYCTVTQAAHVTYDRLDAIRSFSTCAFVVTRADAANLRYLSEAQIISASTSTTQHKLNLCELTSVQVTTVIAACHHATSN